MNETLPVDFGQHGQIEDRARLTDQQCSPMQLGAVPDSQMLLFLKKYSAASRSCLLVVNIGVSIVRHVLDMSGCCCLCLLEVHGHLGSFLAQVYVLSLILEE